MAKHIVQVKIPAAEYDVVIEPGLVDRLGVDLIERTGAQSACIVFDKGLPKSILAQIEASFPAGFATTKYALPGGEKNKSLERVSEAYDAFLAARIDRKTPIIAVGGGVAGDLAGFVAATILRGVPLVQVPTSLLAMVDSSVGGKVGVNHGTYKNMVGAFKQPAVVYCDPNVLASLPKRELCNGLAECIKHAIIRDALLFADMEANLSKVMDRETDYLTDLIAKNVAIKARVVEKDVHELGERAHLNFGHTFGHAIETVSEHEYAHGEAISLGMCAASFAATKLGMLKEEDRKRIVKLLGRAGLPTTGLDLEETAVYSAMRHDKKVAGTKIRFVLPDRIGNAVVRDDVPRSLVAEAINSLRSE